ncbi:hypothetical protein B1R94_26665 [Mycolicibacterium litorale]|nr:hypothetical protein B1R94_26665 [Mycolicibacterium litorale]
MTEVFLGREALADGLSRHDLQRWYRQMYRGVYVPKYAAPSLRDRTVGAWLYTDRTGVIGGVAASALHGAQWVDDDEPIDVFVGDRRRQPGLTVRMDRVSDDEVTTVAGLAVTTPSRTAFDMGRYLKRSVALARLDALMRATPFAGAGVELLMRRYGPVRGVRQLRDLLPLVDAGAQSPKESWLRLLLIDGGLPKPETQIPILQGGVPIAYLDMGYRAIKLAFEYDGDQHRTDRRQYVKDLRRLPAVERLGWEVIRVVAEDRQAEVLWRAKEAFLRRGGAEIDKMQGSSRTFAA